MTVSWFFKKYLLSTRHHLRQWIIAHHPSIHPSMLLSNTFLMNIVHISVNRKNCLPHLLISPSDSGSCIAATFAIGAVSARTVAIIGSATVATVVVVVTTGASCRCSSGHSHSFQTSHSSFATTVASTQRLHLAWIGPKKVSAHWFYLFKQGKQRKFRW